jgi:glycosyltransferase involved in cell wall biosynthesis
MRVAFYGNNLNFGYFFVRGLSELGVTAQLFTYDYHYEQESHHWWTDGEQVAGLVRRFPVKGFGVGAREPLLDSPDIRELYEAAAGFDVVVMMEDGPAVFSDFHDARKVFLSAGADLQLLPFLLRVFHSPSATARGLLGLQPDGVGFPRSAVRELRERSARSRVQERQRRGLRGCDALVCAPYQRGLIEELGLSSKRIEYLPLPMDSTVLDEVDDERVQAARARYADVDLLLLHPARQHFLKLDRDVFLKDNHHLIMAYARFVKETGLRTRLLMLEKGREQDLRAAHSLVDRLGISEHVEWLPEMPNKELRAYYLIEHCCVCIEFSPTMAILGNIGREASFYGTPIIAAFAAWNAAYFGDDMPPHVLPAETPSEILAALRRVANMSERERRETAVRGKEWYQRQLDSRSLMQRYVDLLSDVCASG